MLFGALGSAITADTLGNVQSSTGDNVIEAGEEVAIYVEVDTSTSTFGKMAAAKAAVDAVGDALTAVGIDKAISDLNKALIAAGVVNVGSDPPTVLNDIAALVVSLDTGGCCLQRCR